MNDQASVVNSPWFWILLFSVFALILLVVFGPKYYERQAKIELQYQARERIAEGATDDPDRQAYSTPEATLVRLWPLAAVLSGAAVVSAIVLARDHSRRVGRVGETHQNGNL